MALANIAPVGIDQADALGLAKDLSGVQVLVHARYAGAGYGEGVLNRDLIDAGNVLPADWTTTGGAIAGQGGTSIEFEGRGARLAVRVGGMSERVCAAVVSNSSGAQWGSVEVSGATFESFPIAKDAAGGACKTVGQVVFVSR